MSVFARAKQTNKKKPQTKKHDINKITLHQGTDLDNSCVRVRD